MLIVFILVPTFFAVLIIALCISQSRNDPAAIMLKEYDRQNDAALKAMDKAVKEAYR